MDIYRTEEEQIVAIQNWWKNYGSAIVWGVILSLALIAGWRMYAAKSTEASEAAFTGFMNVQEAFQAAIGKEEGSTEDKTVLTEAQKLFDQYDDHAYAHLAALMLAKHHVNLSRWEEAAQVLQSTLSSDPPDSIRILVKSRFARILAYQKKYDEAVDILQSESDLNDFTAIYQELLGDIYLEQGETEKARAAYQKALLESDDETGVLKMKLDDLAISTAS